MADSLDLYCSVAEALGELQHGRVLVVIDSKERYSEAHLVVAADAVSLDMLRFMGCVAGGLMCLAEPSGSSSYSVPEVIRVEFSGGASFGTDQRATRAHIGCRTEFVNSACHSTCNDTARSLLPLRTRKHGVLSRPGHAEAIVDLARLAGLSPAGFLCAVLQSDGRLLRSLSLLIELSRSHRLRVFCVTELLKHRLASEIQVKATESIRLSTRYGTFNFMSFSSDLVAPCAVLVKGEATFDLCAPFLRVEPVPSIGDFSVSLLTYLRDSFDAALNLMCREGSGIVICLPTPQPASSGETESLSFFREDPFLTLWASPYRRLISAGLCAQILHYLNADHIRVISDGARRLEDLKLFGIDIVEEVSLSPVSKPGNVQI